MEKRDFEVKKENLSAVQDFITEWCEKNGVSMKILMKLNVCTDEIVSNILFYSGAKSFSITCAVADDADDEIELIFSDDGKKFDPLTEAKEPDVTQRLEERKIGGLGIFMVKKMMKSCSYSRKDNINELVIRTTKE